MKNRTILFGIAVLVMAAMAQAAFAQVGADGTKSAAGEASPAMAALQTAYSLAKYGYANESASALIEAAEILAQTQTQPMGAKPEQGSGSADAAKKTPKPEFTAANLLADGKKYAAGDKTMLAWAAEVEKALKVKTRGAVGGPRYQVDRVPAGTRNRYQLSFKAGQTAEIAVSGDGDTDLDLYVYDSNGNLIEYDEGRSDDCYVRWTPKWTGGFTIDVVNRGRVYNQFEIATN
jgi:hypothetical protein